jgi:hypothetical protein
MGIGGRPLICLDNLGREKVFRPAHSIPSQGMHQYIILFVWPGHLGCCWAGCRYLVKHIHGRWSNAVFDNIYFGGSTFPVRDCDYMARSKSSFPDHKSSAASNNQPMG